MMDNLLQIKKLRVTQNDYLFHLQDFPLLLAKIQSSET